MVPVRRGIVIGSIIGLLAASPVAAHFTEWPSSSEAFARYPGYTTYRTGDTVKATIYAMQWDSTRRSNMLHQSYIHGFRFTTDVQDISDHLSASNRFDTNMPAPYPDRDMEGYRCHESEITSESAGFPVSTSTFYSASVYFSHFWYAGGWVWDSNGGTLSFSEQLSGQYPFTDDKWNTASPTYGAGAVAQLGTRTYSSLAYPGSPPPGSQPCQSDGGPLAPASSAAAEDLAAFAVVATGDEPGEVVILPDQSAGLHAYVNKAHALTRALLAHGPVITTVTFARPLGWDDLERVSSSGVTIRSVEAVSSPDEQGLHWTFGDSYGPDAFGFFAAAAQEHGVDLLGVVSAKIAVADVAALNNMLRDSAVYLVDGSAEQVRRSDPQVADALLNDVYWNLVGWTQ